MGLRTEIGEISKLKVQALATSRELLIMRYLGSTCSHKTGSPSGPRKLLYMVVRKSDLKSVSNPQ